jgi:hypothetical protein
VKVQNEKEMMTPREDIATKKELKTCNPSYSGGSDQEDCGSKLAWANSFERPYLKKTLHKKRAGGVAAGVGPEFKP